VLSVYSFLPNIGIPELLIVLAIAILILGPKRIPEAARSLGRGLRGFKDEIGDGEKEKGKDKDKSDPPELADRPKSETKT